MSKSIDALVQASIDSKNYTGVVLARLELLGSDGYLRLANTYQTIYWDEGSPLGEMPYLGIGELGQISVLPETSELTSSTIQLTLTGIPNSVLADGFSDDYRNQPVYIWYATLDRDTYAVEGGQTGPVLAFAGMMDYATIEFGKTATVTITATQRLTDWERPRGGTFNHHYQQTYVDSKDTGFKLVLQLQNKEISWGQYSLTDETTGGVGGTTKCFKYDTKFLMEDGSVKEIQNIEVGDIMLYGGKVEQILKGDGSNQDWYQYEGIEVTGSHPVLENRKWILVEDSELSIPIETNNYTYSVDNENMLMVSHNKIVFSDYKMFPDNIWQDVMDMIALDYQNNRDEILKQEIKRLKI